MVHDGFSFAEAFMNLFFITYEVTLMTRKKYKTYSGGVKRKILKEIQSGTIAKDLITLYPQVPSKTIYDWSVKYKVHKSHYGKYTIREVSELLARLDKATQQLELLRSSSFIQNATRTERMIEMKHILNEDRDNKYTQKELCEAFDIDRSTFHHFIYDSKLENGKFVIRRRRLTDLVMKIFMESDRTWGASAIRSVIINRYHEQVSEGYVRDIMRELGIHGKKYLKKQKEERINYTN